MIKGGDMVEQKKAAPKAHEQRIDLSQLKEIAHDRHEAMRSNLERAEQEPVTHDNEHDAFIKATELADEANDKRGVEKTDSTKQRYRGAPTKKQLRSTFNSQMKEVRGEMSTSSKLVSKFIHLPAVESVSDRIGSTIARPNALLSGSIAAFVGIMFFYFIARHYGYQLSGFETIGAFVLGWTVGIIYDYLTNLFRNKRKK